MVTGGWYLPVRATLKGYSKLLVSAKPFSLFKKIKGRFPFGDSDLFRYFVLAKELYNDEQKYTFYRTADVRPTTFFT